MSRAVFIWLVTCLWNSITHLNYIREIVLLGYLWDDVGKSTCLHSIHYSSSSLGTQEGQNTCNMITWLNTRVEHQEKQPSGLGAACCLRIGQQVPLTWHTPIDLITSYNLTFCLEKKVILSACLTHCRRVTQICIFMLQLCRTGDADLRF